MDEFQKVLKKDFLFGDEDEIKIRRHGNSLGSIYIGNRDLVGVTKMRIDVEAGKPVRYWVEGEVLN